MLRGRRAARSFRPTTRGSSSASRRPRTARSPRTPFERRRRRDGSIVLVGPEVDEAYIAAVVGESVSHARDLSIVYTPMHGVGETSVAAALKTAGFHRVNILASQRTPDGDFPNVPGHVSNPENPQDARGRDRRGQGHRRRSRAGQRPRRRPHRRGDCPSPAIPDGDWTTLDGNQIGVLLAAFVMKETEALGRLRTDHYLVTTLVTSQMARALAEREGVRIEDDLLVGFKWIGERIDEAGPAGFLFGFEESHGYLKGTHVRDKDAAVAALLFAELAATVKDRKQTVLEYLDDLYVDVGHYGERLINKIFEGREGRRQDQGADGGLPHRPAADHRPGLTVTEVHDYKTHEIRDLTGSASARPLPQPSGDLLIFHTEAPGTRFAARPSGTEPKIKFYLFARTDGERARRSSPRPRRRPQGGLTR